MPVLSLLPCDLNCAFAPQQVLWCIVHNRSSLLGWPSWRDRDGVIHIVSSLTSHIQGFDRDCKNGMLHLFKVS